VTVKENDIYFGVGKRVRDANRVLYGFAVINLHLKFILCSRKQKLGHSSLVKGDAKGYKPLLMPTIRETNKWQC